MKKKLTNTIVDALKTVETVDTPDGPVTVHAPYDVYDTEVPQLVLRVTAAGHKSYFARYRRPDGKQTRAKLGDASELAVSQARDAARDKLSGIKLRGEDPVEAKRQAKKEAITLKQFLEGRYWNEVLKHKKAGANTKQRIASRFEGFLDRRLNDKTLGNAVKTWRAKRLAEGVTKSTVNKDTTVLRALFNEAVRLELIDRNPLASMKQYEKADRAIVRFLSPDEETRLRTALAERDRKGREGRISYNKWADERKYPHKPDIPENGFVDHLTPMVLLSMNTGLRRGETFGLMWSDVDFTHAVLHVRGETSKTGDARHVPLNAEALDVLQRWAAQTTTEGLVFPGKTGNKFDTIKKSWCGVLEDAEISNFRWHDLRHHAASRLVQNGVGLAVIKELLGHSDFKLTARYSHLAPGALAEAVNKLGPAPANVVTFEPRAETAQG